jgi:hypothetical protein
VRAVRVELAVAVESEREDLRCVACPGTERDVCRDNVDPGRLWSVFISIPPSSPSSLSPSPSPSAPAPSPPLNRLPSRTCALSGRRRLIGGGGGGGGWWWCSDFDRNTRVVGEFSGVWNGEAEAVA